ncbi:magnesium chelatase, partial [Pseudomonas aeruginosa]|nr:magnesium chelatase [Pseudomonas aeruginosa]
SPPPSAANPPPPPAAPAALPERAGDGEGQWGELPARPVAMGTARELPRWPKKP